MGPIIRGPTTIQRYTVMYILSLGTSQEEKQPNQLQTPSKDYIKTKPLALPVRAVEPSYVHGLNLDNANAPKR